MKSGELTGHLYNRIFRWEKSTCSVATRPFDPILLHKCVLICVSLKCLLQVSQPEKLGLPQTILEDGKHDYAFTHQAKVPKVEGPLLNPL